ncbi:MAG: hypothetical protein GY711_14680 [bacterium]|nr:hypothetical protein [bacterium]
MHRHITTCVLSLLNASSGVSQDMIGVDFFGTTYDVDSATGAASVLGSAGVSQVNCMASSPGGTIYVVGEQGDRLVTLDPDAGASTSSSFIGLGDVRGLAFSQTDGLLYAVKNVVPNSTTTIDEIWTIDPGSLALNQVGATGFAGVQALAFATTGELYGYELGNGGGVGVGLVRIDVTTGVATDVNGAVGNTGGCQFMTSDANGTMYVGQLELFVVDVSTAAETLVGATGVDLRGLDFKTGGPPGCRGTVYCSPAIPNSTGASGVLCATGSLSIPANNLTLTATELPPGQFGYFLVSATQGSFVPPGSTGFLCLSNNIGRFNMAAQIIQGPTGVLQIDLGAIPVNPPVATQSGDLWDFQCWYRDIGGTSNFTDAVSILFP